MNDLHRALGDISDIRRQVANSTEFRGYGPATLAATSLIALAACAFQAHRIPDPAAHTAAYLALWASTAIVGGTLTAVQMFTRTRRVHSGLSDEMLHMAVEQFLPAAGAGLLLTIVLPLYVPAAIWMLPGLWQIVFSLGIFSSCRFLPRPMLAAGGWYLAAGLVCLALGDTRALSPWAMAIPFGAGQLLVAGILFFASHPDEAEADDEV
jgi:hypothetical protein